MPAKPSELQAMKQEIDKHIGADCAQALFDKMYNDIGAKSDNLSFKMTLLMMQKMFNQDGRTMEGKMMELKQVYLSYFWKDKKRDALKCLLWFIVFAHFCMILGMLSAVPFLLWFGPWYIALPCIVYISNLLYTATPCTMTKLENQLREKLGMPTIRGFIKYYVFNKTVKENVA